MRKRTENKRKSVYIAFASGCPRSEMDTAWLFPYFRANGWNVVDRPHKADLVVAAGCGFEAVVEDETVQRLMSLKAKLDGTPLIVTGCLAGVNPARIADQLGATPVRPADVEELDRIISAKVSLSEVPPINDVGTYINAAMRCWRFGERAPNAGRMVAFREGSKELIRSWLRRVGLEEIGVSAVRNWRRLRGQEVIFRIRVARGCLEECSYCAIRAAAGTLRSKPLDDVLAEFDRGLSQGYRRFELIGEDLGPYGLDIGTTLPALLEGIFSRKRDFKLIFTDVNGRYVIQYDDQLTTLLKANHERVQRLKIPIQSGSDRVLELMRRCYTSGDIRRILSRLLENCPSMPLETHVLVGFPGEREEDFMATVELLRAVKFVRIQVYRYTDRPGTPASEMGQKVPSATKEDRVRRLLAEFPQAK
jgi:tRNA A37 methylthiotransferase MiaB